MTVILDREDYSNKMLDQINDRYTYRELQENPIDMVRKQDSNLMDKWLKKGYIEAERRDLLTSECNIVRCYGLPKLNKTVRMIVSTIDLLTYK